MSSVGYNAQVDEEDYYVLLEERIEIREFQTVMDVISNLIKTLNDLPPLLYPKEDQKIPS